VDRGEVGLDEPVAAYWPEFAAGGKGAITVRDLLSHRAGLFDVRRLARRAEELLDHVAVEDRLASLPAHRTSRPAYHAITFGWLVAGLARRVTGRGMRELVRTEVAEPLGTEGLSIGRPDGDDVAEILGLSLRSYGRAAKLTSPLFGRLPPTRAATSALLVPGFHRLFEGSSPAVWTTEMPAVNGYLSADGLARMYGALAGCGGRGEQRLLRSETVHELGRVQSRGFDAVLGVRMRWRLGYHQAFGLGKGSGRSFGHYGFAGSGGWADPDTGVSLGFVTNNVSRLTTPIGDFTLFRLSALARQCAVAAAAA
jgi:CubicO group peptidase (beta-lactamase class C family)